VPIQPLPSGTRGARVPPRPLMRILMPIMRLIHRRSGDRFRGSNLLYLVTVGARTGERRTTPVARFDDGEGGWFVVASFGGAARHPGWYHNIAAHPDQVWAEVRGTTHHVRAEQLDGAAYEQAWAQITTASPSFLDYLAKTDRRIPVLRLTPTNPGRPDDVPDKAHFTAHFTARADVQRTDVETVE
jgi:deazaflavin-dependent oxidoreductase (nitroreductase family)